MIKKAWLWLVQAAKDIFAFVYQEIGRILAVLKNPAGKFSGKRIIALALVADVIFFDGIPKDKLQWAFAALKLLLAGGLYVLAELTKT